MLRGPKVWSPALDVATVPDSVLFSEAGRRNAARRKSYGPKPFCPLRKAKGKGGFCDNCPACKQRARRLAKRAV